MIRDQREVAETLNEFFSKNISTEQTVIKNTNLMSDFMHIPSDIRSGCTSLRYTKPTEVREVISKMKINKAVGHDLIPAGALKSQLKSYAVVSTGFNFILNTSKIPQMWKKGEITQVHKECTPTKGNCRPLTILPLLS